MGKFKPLTLTLVEEGRFVAEIDAALAQIQARMVRYVKEHGCERSAGAKAKITVGMIIAYEGPNPEDFSLKGTLQISVPSRPPVVTRATADMDDSGEPALFVRASGSTADDPRQGVLMTEDGRLVDESTGEVKDERAARKL